MIKKIPMRKRFVTQCYFWFVSTNAPFPRIRTLLKPHFNPNRYSRTLRLRANGRNIVDQQLPTLLDVICCVRLHTLLHVVGCCCAKFETGQTFRPVQTDATLLAYNSRHCWELLRPFARSLTLESGFKKMLSFGLTDFVWEKSRFVQKYMQF